MYMYIYLYTYIYMYTYVDAYTGVLRYLHACAHFPAWVRLLVALSTCFLVCACAPVRVPARGSCAIMHACVRLRVSVCTRVSERVLYSSTASGSYGIKPCPCNHHSLNSSLPHCPTGMDPPAIPTLPSFPPLLTFRPDWQITPPIRRRCVI